jgi:hypothetical protein
MSFSSIHSKPPKSSDPSQAFIPTSSKPDPIRYPTWAPSSSRHVGGDPFWNLPVNYYYHYYYFWCKSNKNQLQGNKIQSTCELWMNQRQLAKSSTKLIRRNSDDVTTTTEVVDVGLSNWAN